MINNSEQGRQTLTAAAIYFAAVFGAGFLLGIIRSVWIVPEIGTRWGELLEMPVMFLVILLSARRVSRHLVAPGSALFVGVLALAFLVMAEFTFAFLLRHLVLLCYKRRVQQKGQCGSWVRRKRAILIRRVAIEAGLCRSARARRAARLEVGRKLRGA